MNLERVSRQWYWNTFPEEPRRQNIALNSISKLYVRIFWVTFKSKFVGPRLRKIVIPSQGARICI